MGLKESNQTKQQPSWISSNFSQIMLELIKLKLGGMHQDNMEIQSYPGGRFWPT